MPTTTNEIKRRLIALQIPKSLRRKYYNQFPANWRASFSQDTPLATLERDKLPISPELSFIIILIIYKDFPANQLLSYAKNELKIDDQSICDLCAAIGHLDSLKALRIELADNFLVLVREHNYSIFQQSCYSGQLHVAQWLAEQFPDELSAMIQVNIYEAFRKSCTYGHLDTAKWLAEQFPDELSAMVKACHYEAFRYSCVRGHLNTAKWLAEQFPDELSAIIKLCDYQIFDLCVQDKSVKAAKWLLNDIDCLAFAEMHISEYSEIVTPYIKNAIQSLQQQFRAHDDIRQPFNIDEQEALRAFYMLRHLIRLNAPEHHDDIVFLLSLPAVKGLAHQAVRDGASNELLRLALTQNNQDAATILLGLPEVQALAERNDYYRAEALGRIDLSAIAQDHESSMRSLNSVEKKRLEKASSRYQPMLKQAGTEAIIDELKAMLIRRFHANPIRVDGIVLPMDYQDFQNLGLNDKQKAKALKVYYQHPDHTAYRYLSKPNHWMHENAGYVCINKARTERWSTFEKYRPEIALHFLAAIDKTMPAIDGHTYEGRITHFIHEIALIGRAHNWDKLRINDDGKEEEYDDSEGDRPSCYSGVKRRLFQSVVGHPDFTVLSAQMIDDEINFFVFNYYLPKINNNDFRQVFKDIYEHINDSLEPLNDAHVQFLRDANIPDTEIDAFTVSLSTKYGNDYDKVPEYPLMVTDAFALTPKFGQQEVFHLIGLGVRAGLFNQLKVMTITNGNASSNQFTLFPPAESQQRHSDEPSNRFDLN